MSGTSASVDDGSLSLEILSIDEKNGLENSSRSYIHRVPTRLRGGCGESYDPVVVSIGPYHYGTKRGLEVTDKHKRLYLSALIDRNTTKNHALPDMIKRITSIQDSCRACYANSFTLNNEKFRNMLILDGCFIIELLFRFQLEKHNEVRKKDILLSNKFVVFDIMRDLVLLENQIPYKVLRELFQITSTTAPTPKRNLNIVTLNDHIIDFFRHILPDKQETAPNMLQGNEKSDLKGKHILDLLLKYLLPAQQRGTGHTVTDIRETGHTVTDIRETGHTVTDIRETFSPDWEHTNCVTDLDEAGVKFEKKVPNDGLLDISFANGKFQIPPFYFGKSWTVLLRNMVALEQCRGDYPDKITSYVFLVNNLIDSHKDVKLLRSKGIITSTFHEDEIIAIGINNLSKNAVYNDFYYDSICHDVNKFRKSFWPKWRAHYMRNYVHTPWAGVSAAAAILLMVLALTQTICSILQLK